MPVCGGHGPVTHMSSRDPQAAAVPWGWVRETSSWSYDNERDVAGVTGLFQTHTRGLHGIICLFPIQPSPQMQVGIAVYQAGLQTDWEHNAFQTETFAVQIYLPTGEK